jgi:hypothetical protein
MTLKQAFTIWALIPKNIALAASSREPVQRVLMKKYNDVDLESFTENFCRRLFALSTERQELKTQAASILSHVLEWGAENGHCKKPSFSFEIASKEEKKLRIQEKPQQFVVKQPKSHHGKPPRKVCQLDMKTLRVLKTFESVAAAITYTGNKNLRRSIQKCHSVAGFYWVFPEDVATFKPQQKYQTRRKINKETSVMNELGEQQTTKLSEFSDQELLAEIKRRGWKGNVTFTVNANL